MYRFHEHIPSVVFYNRRKVASSLSLLKSALGELCSGWGKFSLGFLASLICSKFSDFVLSLESQVLPTHMWCQEVEWEGRRNVSETQTQHNVFFLRNFIKAPVPVTSPPSNASFFALNQSWLVVVVYIFGDLQAYCFWCCKGKSWGLVSGLWDQSGWYSLCLPCCTLKTKRKLCMEDETVDMASNIYTWAFKVMHAWVDLLYSLQNKLKLNHIYHHILILHSVFTYFPKILCRNFLLKFFQFIFNTNRT